MDAAQRLLKNSAILAATALLMATVGLAQPTLNVATSVTMAGTGGQDVSVTSSGSPTTEITYAIGAPSYAADGGGSWLGVTGGTTTPASLSFSLARAPLTGGAHVATVTLTPDPVLSPGVAAVTITVTYNSGRSGGGGASVLSASPTTVSLTAGANSQASYPVAITTTSASAITISMTASVTGSVTSWLSNSSLATNTISSSGGTTLTIIANSSNLATGSYQGTVTITPSTVLPLNITVNFTVGSTVGNGTWYATPGSVAWNFTSNSGSYPSQAISISTTSGSATYSATTSANENNWLQVYTAYNGSSNGISGIAVGTQLGLTVDSQVNSLSTGAHYGYVYIYDSNGAQQLTITVTITVNGTTSTSLTVTPNPISINVAVNGTQQSQTVSVYSSGGGYLTISASLPSGLTYQLPTNNLVAAGGSTAFTVYANPYGLAANTYSSTLYVYVGSQSAAVPVSMIVGGGNSNTLTVTPNPISINVAVNGAQQSQTVSVYSSAGGYLSISPSLPSGLTYQLPTNNLVAAGGSTTFTVYASPYGLAANTYSGTLYVYVGSQSAAVPVSMVVCRGSSTTLTVTPNPISLNVAVNGAQQSLTVSVYSGSGGTLTISPSLPSGLTYQLPSNTTVAAGGSVAFTVYANPYGLAANTYSGTLYVYVGSQSAAVPVSMVVGGGSSTTLTVTPNPISLNVAVNGAQQSQTVSVYSGSGGMLTISPSLPTGLTVQLPSNTTVAAGGSVAFTVYANPYGLAANTYSGTLYVYVGSQSAAVPVSMIVGGGGTGTTAVAPASLNFAYQIGTDPVNFVARQKLVITGTAGAWSSSVSTADGGTWLKLSPTGGTALPSPADDSQAPFVRIDATGLNAGSYGGTIVINTPGASQSISVSLTVGTTTVLLPTPSGSLF